MMRIATAVGIASMLAACNPHKVTENPAPPISVPATYGSSTGGVLPEKWWATFGDAELDGLIERALAGNLQLRAGWARVRQVRSLVKQGDSAKWPQVDGTIAASRQKNRFDLGDPVGEVTPTTNTFTTSVSAGYELDIWRAVDHSSQALHKDEAAVRDSAEAMALAISAEVTEAWLDIVSVRAQLELLRAQIETNEKFLEVIKLRFTQGLASALDVYQQEQQLIATSSQVALLEAAEKLHHHRIALLLGEAPGAIDVSTGNELPDMPPIPGVGIPADLLDRRPDVRAARRQVEAADHRVAVAVADRLPRLRLSGSVSLQSGDITELIASPLWQLLGSITGPLFDGGRRSAEVERTKDVVDEKLMDYGQVLLQAMVEVENALVQEKSQLEYIAELEKQLEVLANTLREAQNRYRQGLIDYLPVLSALQAKQRAALNIIQARRQLLSYRVQLCRALGGTWTSELAVPERGGDS